MDKEFFAELQALLKKYNLEFEHPDWPEGLTVSGTDRFTRNQGGGIWRIKLADFDENEIEMETLDGEQEITCTGQDLLGDEFTKLVPNARNEGPELATVPLD